MQQFIQADTAVAAALLSRLTFTSYNSIVEARTILGGQLRLSMQHTQCYQIAIAQQLPDGMGIDAAAQYVHPWNIAAALLNVCANGIRFGGENLAPQEDLMVYVADWVKLQGCTFPTVPLPITEPAPAPAPTPPILPSAEAQQPLPGVAAPAQATLSPVAQALIDEADAEAAQAPLTGREASVAAEAVAQTAPVQEAASDGPEPGENLPSSDIKAQRTGQSGRPQKSPFEKKIEERNKVADAPFWWKHMLVTAPKLFTQSPAAALDDSSTGAGPVQSYMVLLALLQEVLKELPPRTTVAELRNFLREVDMQVHDLEWRDAANQLRKALMFR